MDDVVYIGTWNGFMHAINANTGELVWEYSDGDGAMGHVYGHVAHRERVIYFSTGAGSGFIKRDDHDYTGWIYALSIENGDLIWDFPVGDEAGGSVALWNNTLYASFGFMGHLSGDGLWAVDTISGQLRWYFDTKGEPVIGSPAVDDSRVYFTCTDGYLYAIDREEGTVIWKHFLGGRPKESPIVVGNKLLIAHESLKIFNAATGEFISSYWTEGTAHSVSYAYGNVYVIGYQEGIRAFGPKIQEPIPVQSELILLVFIVVGIVIVIAMGASRTLSRKGR
jgi:outer membrane protein assembly factor BamB